MTTVSIALDPKVTHARLAAQCKGIIHPLDLKMLVPATLCDVPSVLKLKRTSLVEEGYSFPEHVQEVAVHFGHSGLIPMSPTALLALIAKRFRYVGKSDLALVRFPRHKKIEVYELNSKINLVALTTVPTSLIRADKAVWLCIAEDRT